MLVGPDCWGLGFRFVCGTARSLELFEGSRVESFGPSPQVTMQLGKGRGWTLATAIP